MEAYTHSKLKEVTYLYLVYSCSQNAQIHKHVLKKCCNINILAKIKENKCLTKILEVVFYLPLSLDTGFIYSYGLCNVFNVTALFTGIDNTYLRQKPEFDFQGWLSSHQYKSGNRQMHMLVDLII